MNDIKYYKGICDNTMVDSTAAKYAYIMVNDKYIVRCIGFNKDMKIVYDDDFLNYEEIYTPVKGWKDEEITKEEFFIHCI